MEIQQGQLPPQHPEYHNLVHGDRLSNRPLSIGWAYDQFGSYNIILTITPVIWALGAVLAFLAPSPQRND